MEKKILEKKEGQKEKKISKEESQEMLKNIFKNLIIAISIMLYFVVLNIAYVNMKIERLVVDIKVFSGTFLAIGLFFFEKAYRKDNGKFILPGIELILLSFHSLSIMHFTNLFKYDFRLYLLTSSYIISIYFVLKAIVLYTKEKRDYLKNLSDISEIVKEEPIKKEATKKNKESEEKSEEIETLKGKEKNKKIDQELKRKDNKKDNAKTKKKKENVKSKETNTSKTKKAKNGKDKKVTSKLEENKKKKTKKEVNVND